MGDTPPIGIGQGYNAFTLLQLAHATATLANRGRIMTPPLVESITNPISGEVTKVADKSTGTIQLKKSNVDAVIAGMIDAASTGTARAAFRGAPYTVAGKTGTAEHGSEGETPHSWFVGFSNADDPDIVIAVVAENGGYSSQVGVPISRQIIEAYYAQQ